MHPFFAYLGRRFLVCLPIFILLSLFQWFFGAPALPLPVFMIQIFLVFLIVYWGEYETTTAPTAPVSGVGLLLAGAAGFLVVLLDKTMGTGPFYGYFTGSAMICLYLMGRHGGRHRGMTPVAKKVLKFFGVQAR